MRGEVVILDNTEKPLIYCDRCADEIVSKGRPYYRVAMARSGGSLSCAVLRRTRPRRKPGPCAPQQPSYDLAHDCFWPLMSRRIFILYTISCMGYFSVDYPGSPIIIVALD